jgi:hypothetical protein
MRANEVKTLHSAIMCQVLADRVAGRRSQTPLQRRNLTVRGVFTSVIPSPVKVAVNKGWDPGAADRASRYTSFLRPISRLEFFQQKASRFSNLSNIRQVISLV